ncbi:hypothetical protein [Methanobacterium aggregans]|uniref:hypothetical protein n=1 Tax=Methanobacterium aggregans TaxID=1615586 RepID=UPI001AE2D8E0|nr:hypothetical protein [Methanobacterium aggregans]MBP2046096.1 hypothetical protein [Methanobacterium aggregans]
MVSSIEIKIRNESKRKGLDPDEVLQLMEVPFEWTGDSYLFDFGSMSVEKLSDYIDFIFRKRGYSLGEGTQIDGVYVKTRFGDSLAYKRLPIEYRYKVGIYLNGEKTCLEISRAVHGGLMSADKRVYGENYLNSELNKIVDQLQFLKPSIKGYLVCNKCGAYYEVHKDESPEDFPDECECGGNFEYIAIPDFPDEKIVERKKTATPTEYLRTPAALILVSLACILSVVYNPSQILTLGMVGLAFSMIFVLIRVKSQELVLNTISRRLFYFLTAILFFAEGWGLGTMPLPTDNYNANMIMTSFFMIVAVIFGLGMIFKVFSPDNPRNFLDPPL